MPGLNLHLVQQHLIQRKYLAQFRRAPTLRHIGREQKCAQKVRNMYLRVLHRGLQGFDPRASLQLLVRPGLRHRSSKDPLLSSPESGARDSHTLDLTPRVAPIFPCERRENLAFCLPDADANDLH